MFVAAVAKLRVLVSSTQRWEFDPTFVPSTNDNPDGSCKHHDADGRHATGGQPLLLLLLLLLLPPPPLGRMQRGLSGSK